MNIKNYFIDEKVLDILFSPQNEERKAANIKYVQDLNLKVILGISWDYLVSKGIPDVEIAKYFDVEDDNVNPEYRKMFDSDEYRNYVNEKLNDFNRIFITTRLAKLPETRQNELEEYMASMQESLEILSEANKDMGFKLSEIKRIVEEEGISQDELNQIVNTAVTEKFGLLEKLQKGDLPGTEDEVSTKLGIDELVTGSSDTIMVSNPTPFGAPLTGTNISEQESTAPLVDNLQNQQAVSNGSQSQNTQPVPTDQNQEYVENVSIPKSDRPVENVIQVADLPSDSQQVSDTPPVADPVSPQDMETVSAGVQPYDNPPVPPTT